MNEDLIREVVSPEGVEEQLVEEVVFQVTRTLGGKYRTYVKRQNGSQVVPDHIRVHDDRDSATKCVGEEMAILGMVMNDPKGTMDRILEGLKKK